MNNYAIYHRRSGSISHIYSGPEDTVAMQCDVGYGCVKISGNVTDDSHYIASGVVVKKDSLAPSIAVNGLTAIVTGLPPGVTVYFENVKGRTDDSPLELDVDDPGVYTLRAEGNVKYREASWEITFG